MLRNKMFERRKHVRAGFEVSAKYREVLSDDYIVGKRNQAESLAINISKGGMQIVTDSAWAETGDRLIEIEFNLMKRDMKIIAHVVWYLFDETIKKFRSGVEFIVIKSGDLEVIGNIN